MSYYQALTMFANSRYEEAERKTRELIGEDVENGELYELLARCLHGQGKYKEATSTIERAISLDPNSAEAHEIHALVLVERERYRPALAAIENSIQLDPEDSTRYAIKARILGETGKTVPAIQATDAGLKIDPECEACLFFRGILKGKQGHSDEADRDTLELLRSDPEDASNHCARGFVLLEKGDGPGAEKHFLEALRIDANSEDARAGLSRALGMQNVFLGAILRALNGLARLPLWVLLIGFVAFARLDKLIESIDSPIATWAAHIARVLFCSLWLGLVVAPIIFDTVIARNRRGRLALPDLRVKAVKVALVPFVIAIVYFILFAILGVGRSLPTHCLGWLASARMLYEAGIQANRNVRNRMRMVAAVCLFLTVALEAHYYMVIRPWAQDVGSRFAETIQADVPASEFSAGETPADVGNGMPGDLANSKNKEVGTSAPEQASRAVGEMASDLSKLGSYVLWTFRYPMLALLLVACFADDIASWFIRRAPDDR